jgi:mutator protein MutT
VIRALVMAGGQGARMRASGTDLPKPLVEVRGVALLERSLHRLCAAGVADITIAVPRAIPAVGAFARGRGQLVAGAAGATLTVLEETTPLGTIGAAALARREGESLLVVNADNLTTLDLAAFAAAHVAGGGAMTVAAHRHALRLPYAELELEGGRVVGCVEKPAHRFTVSSAVYALGRRALAELSPGARADAPDLVRRLLAAGARVDAYEHAAPWIDVNDAGGVAAAERLVAEHADAFECWHPSPAVEVVGCVLARGGEVLLERRAATARCYADQWDTPGGKLEPGETPARAMARELVEELGVAPAELRHAGRFDDVDATSRQVFRHHVFAAGVAAGPRAREGQRIAWMPRAQAARLPDLGVAARRSLAAVGAAP